MNIKFLNALMEWQKQGKRKVEIKFDYETGFLSTPPEIKHTISIWIYDAKYSFGKFIKKIEEIPSNKKLMEIAKNDLLASIENRKQSIREIEEEQENGTIHEPEITKDLSK